ncbi:MAG: TetR/AcrR family transcriptional regulator [Cryobacterium sp.]|nr:TetR/AcrR family transcriptional regulator [Cryobacterium sp.]
MRRSVGRPGEGEDVRGAILAAALRLLEATGSPDRVTVAAIVNEAGCTPPSLYHYWPKREILLQEASSRGWSQFRASQASAVSDHHDPVERLRLRGRAYLEFARAKPSLFAVLFLEPSAAASGDNPTEVPPEAGNAGTGGAATGEAFNDLVTDVSAAMATGQLRPADPLTTALALWSAVHGVAALWAVTSDLAIELAPAVGDLVLDAVLAGLAGLAG